MTDALKEFYKNLQSKQEPLGPEFEKVLEDNFWDLFDEGDNKNAVHGSGIKENPRQDSFDYGRMGEIEGAVDLSLWRGTRG